MNVYSPNKIINQQTGNLSLELFSFTDKSYFDRVQYANYFSLIWIKEGSGIAKVKSVGYKFSDNNFFSFAPHQAFKFNVADSFKGMVLNFHPEFFCVYYHNEQIACEGVLFNNIYNAPFIELGKVAVEEFDELFTKIGIEMQNQEFAKKDMLISYMKILLIAASRLKVEQQEDVRYSIFNENTPLILKKLKKLIETDFRIKHSPKDYASELNISPNALTKIVKKHFNRTFKELL